MTDLPAQFKRLTAGVQSEHKCVAVCLTCSFVGLIWQPLRIAGYCVELFLMPAQASPDSKDFDQLFC